MTVKQLLSTVVYDQMPLLSSNFLQKHKELRLAHLALSMMTMGYVWEEGEKDTVEVTNCLLVFLFLFLLPPVFCFLSYSFKILPRSLAVPYWEVSQRLGLPPIITHADAVLANWKRKDPDG